MRGNHCLKITRYKLLLELTNVCIAQRSRSAAGNGQLLSEKFSWNFYENYISVNHRPKSFQAITLYCTCYNVKGTREGEAPLKLTIFHDIMYAHGYVRAHTDAIRSKECEHGVSNLITGNHGILPREKICPSVPAENEPCLRQQVDEKKTLRKCFDAIFIIITLHSR